MHHTHLSNPVAQLSQRASMSRRPSDPLDAAANAHFESLHSDRRPLFHSSNPNRRLTHSRRPRASHQNCDHDPCVGAEPGVNPRSGASDAEYSHFKQSCTIDVIDYDSEEVTSSRMGNNKFIHMMSTRSPSRDDPLVKPDIERGPPPLAVRWINIGGIDWSVLRAVTLQYDLHSLALEDILHESGHNHSKADYYPEHLFIRILCHTLAPEKDEHLGQDQGFDQLPVETGAPMPQSITSDPSSPSAAERGGTLPTKSLLVPSGSESATPAGSIANIPTLATIIDPLEDRELSQFARPSKYEEMPSPSIQRKSRRRILSNAKDSLRRRLTALSGFHSPARQDLIARIRELKKENRVNVRHQPLFIFLLRNGTVISIHPSPNLNYSAPIADRLHQADSVLRTSDDASILVESLLDLVVDRILEVMDEYQVKIHDLEHKILMNPSMSVVRCLHVLSGDLIMHRRTLDPIKTMIYGLRKYDLDRCIALADNMEMARQQQEEFEERRKDYRKNKKRGSKGNPAKHLPNKVETAVNLETNYSNEFSSKNDGHFRNDDEHLRQFMKTNHYHGVKGYFSYKGKVYLADVYDHMDFALTSLEMFAGISENLINYAFNMSSYKMNRVMSRLTILSIIFLPLTLLTGYFGMNFTPSWSVQENSDLFFWKIAVPVMACLIPLFMSQDVKHMFVYIKRRWQDRKAVKYLLKELEDPNSLYHFDLQV